MPSAARLGDSCAGHGCFPATPIIAGSGDVIINGKPAARKGDAVLLHACPCPNMPHGIHSRAISGGSSNVFINGKAAARVGDAIGCGGSVAAGSGNVIIGDSPYQSPAKSCAEQTAKKRLPLLALSPMLVPWQTLLEWAAPVALPEAEKTLTEAQRKLRYQARKQLSERAAKVPGLVDAGKRLGFNNDSILRAEAAKYVYEVDELNRGVIKDKLSASPVGLQLIDTKKIPGLEATEFTDKESGFGAALFKSSINNENMLTYRGTNNGVTGKMDWMTNIAQGLVGAETKQYTQAMDLATQVQDAVASPSSPLVLVGHSLAGGEASAGVGVTGLPGYTFNAAGLHANTVSRKGGLPLDKIGELITTQAVDGEILTMLQGTGKLAVPTLFAGIGSAVGGTSGAAIGGALGGMLLAGGALPAAAGKMLPLPSQGGNPVARHGMDQVIAGIEAQKSEDIGTITSKLGGVK
ncbi:MULTISPECIES: PAAR domain-containing protein [Aeromonas]|uniref:PAAR domain-containing protein n=1 Tax=Aeromonas TaxID=642 RepID=UPI00049382E5|nr:MULTISPECIES: PAAR domain-containing protein [Aeromonas]KER62536.1 phospholipase [Aeromonas hydrophila]MBW3799058.1 phospholipase [Aeromonas hydrophila]MBW3803803.1 phospholipase [Aeromonas hydrophila]MBW3821586.1 phospholipase [Aeromonas hydrophila]MCX4042990.1 PAAR domain-containing protein [Aeromonas hydrophila]